MDVKQYITLTVGLIIAVVLVAGLMVPVISGLSGGDIRPEYTNSGAVYYKPIGTDNYTLYLEYGQDDYDLATVSISINGGSPRFLGPEWISENNFTAMFYPLLTFTQNGKMGVEGILFNGDFGNMDTQYFTMCGGAGYLRMIEGEENPDYYYLFADGYSLSNRTIQITNGTVTYDFTDSIDAEYDLILSDSEAGATSVWATDNAKVYSDDPTIFFGCVGYPATETDPELGDTVVIDLSLLSLGFDITGADNDVRIYGENSDSAVLEFDSSESEGLYTYSGATINGEDVDGGVIVPISVGGSSGGGSGLSPTLKTVLSVIPLVTVVGIVLGTVGYLRMKER